MSVLARFVRDRRRQTLWWAGGVVLLVLFTVALYPSVRGQASFDEVVRGLPDTVKALLGSQGQELAITSPPGYLRARLFATLFPLMLLIFGIGIGARAIGGSEDEGTLEFVLTHPVARVRVYLERYAAVVALVVVLGLVFAVSLSALSPAFGLLDGVSVGGLLAASAGAICFALIHASLAFAAGGATGKRATGIAVAAVVAVGGYLVYGMLELVEGIRPLRFASPWYWYLARDPLTTGLGAEAIVVPLAVSLVVVALAGRMFLVRDLR